MSAGYFTKLGGTSCLEYTEKMAILLNYPLTWNSKKSKKVLTKAAASVHFLSGAP